MKPISHLAGAAGLFAVLLTAPAWSQSSPGKFDLAQSERNNDNERWQKMSPTEKQELRERYQRWKNLPSNERDELQKNFDNWRKLHPDEKAVARKNFER
ncbi:MAG: DUF3106 domain-containing protein [Deltaproteobacteria bacterium]|nr:DUF3106 domain-containing protein [Deltaproteobacteria bacterium]